MVRRLASNHMVGIYEKEEEPEGARGQETRELEGGRAGDGRGPRSRASKRKERA